jgi:high affinity Mn2+ porin
VHSAAFFRQTIDLGGEEQNVEAAANQLAGTHSENRLVFWLGKFSVVDVFDTNLYAHDPRADFFNWTAIDTGTFDYAADAWGYTAGAALEWYFNSWALRAGLFDLSDVPNSVHLDPGFHEFQTDLELEHRHELGGQRGRLLVTVFRNRGRMGLLDQAVELAQQTAMPVDIAAVRGYLTRLGVSLSLEQQIAPQLGAFVRAGKLPHPGPEQIIETYYSAAVWKFVHVSLDYQWINHPAYNRDRGPVSVVAVRLHAQL